MTVFSTGECNGYRPASNSSRCTDVYSNDTSNIVGVSRYQTQQQQQSSVYDDYRPLTDAAVPSSAASAVQPYPPDSSVFRPIRNAPCSSSQDESWSRFGDDTLSYDDDDEVPAAALLGATGE
jgi:hypothetical protein